MINLLDLHGLVMRQDGEEWHVDMLAERKLLMKHSLLPYFVLSPCNPETVLFGMRVRLDPSLPEGRIELRDHLDRVVGTITVEDAAP